MIGESEMHCLRDRVLLLRSINTLAGLRDADLSALAERMRLRCFEPGDVLFTEADSIDSVFFLLDGTVRIERNGATIGNLGRGTAAGLFAVLAGDGGSVLATVQAPTTAFELSVDVLFRALKRFPALLRHFIRLAAGYLLQARGYLPIQGEGEKRVPKPRIERASTLTERILSFTQTAGVPTKASLSAIFQMVLHATEVRVATGNLLWREGDASTMTLAITSGRVRCTCHNGSESTVGAPFMLGELETLAGSPRPYEAVAETDLLLLRIQRETFYAVIEADPVLGRAMMARIAESLLEIGWGELGEPPRAKA